MKKWIGRVLYILFVLAIVAFIELGFGGAQGIKNGEYISKYALGAVNEDGSYNYQEALLRYNAALGISYSGTSIKNKDNESNYDNSSQVTDSLYQVGFSVYPLISTQKSDRVNIWYDGFYVILDKYSEDISYYSFEFTGINILDPETKIVLKENVEESTGREYNIYMDVNSFAANLRVPYTTYVYNPLFYTEAQKDLAGPLEYDVIGINVYAHPKNEELATKLVYSINDGSYNVVTAEAPLATATNLNLTAETFNISKLLTDAKNPTEAEIATYDILNKYQPIDLSEFNYVYLYIIPIYLVLLVVIPYFWFFHKKVMKKLGLNKKKNSNIDTENIIDVEPEEQLFDDHKEIEEKAKKKK